MYRTNLVLIRGFSIVSFISNNSDSSLEMAKKYNDSICIISCWFHDKFFRCFISFWITTIFFWSVSNLYNTNFHENLHKLLSIRDKSEEYMNYYYITTHTRFGPWLMGLMLGYYLFKLKKDRENHFQYKLVYILIQNIRFFVSISG